MSATSTRSPQSMAGLEEDRFETARAVADAVLYEGYVLYPYRASSRKNQVRFQWGVLALVPTARRTAPNVGRPGPNVSSTWATSATGATIRSSGYASGACRHSAAGSRPD